MDLNKPLEQMTPAELRDAIGSGILSQDARRRAELILMEREAEQDRILRLQKEARKAAKEDARRRRIAQQQKQFKGIDERSVKNSAKNSISAGSAVVGAVTFKEGLEVYGDMREQGLLPEKPLDAAVTVLRALKLTDEQIVYVVSATILGFVLTFIYKAIKHYDEG